MSAPANSSSSTGSSSGSSSGRALTVLLVVLVALVALIAAAVTVLVSQRTHAPSERTLTPSIQVAAGSEHVDDQAGLTMRVPEGWRVQPGDLIFGSTALVPDEADGPGGQPQAGAGPGSLVLIGQVTPEMFGAAVPPDNEPVATALATQMGEIFLPIPGQRVDPRVRDLSGRAGQGAGEGVGVSYRLEPEGGQGMLGPDGALVYSAVIGEGDQRYWLTYIGAPADGSMSSPGAEWADEIAERLTPA